MERVATVILGSRTCEDDRDRVLERVSSDEDLRDVEVLRAVVSDEEFRIELELIERG